MVAVVLDSCCDTPLHDSAGALVLALAVPSYRTLLQSASEPGTVEYRSAAPGVQLVAGLPPMVVSTTTKAHESADLRSGWQSERDFRFIWSGSGDWHVHPSLH